MPPDGIGKYTAFHTSYQLKPLIESMPNDLRNAAAVLVFIVVG
jgi:hypothetical protein